MVYNAMKLFMEINPTLFDECTAAYATDQETAPQRLADRESVWKMLEEKATLNRKPRPTSDGKSLSLSSQSQQVVRGGSPMQITDDSTGESQRQMDALNIQDEGAKVVGVA
jgi:serine/threonine-protein phosphatase 2A regulatory subunit B'